MVNVVIFIYNYIQITVVIEHKKYKLANTIIIKKIQL